jgi:hypothetical protein
MGLGGAIVLLILAFFTDTLRSDTSKSRWKDPTWIAWLAAVAYMLHNFEEYGIDLTGQTLGFWKLMYSANTLVTEGAYLGCNLPFVWVVGPVMALLSRKHPMLVGAMTSFELVNGLSHTGMMFKIGYNSGTATSIAIFLPLAIYTLVVFFGKQRGKYPVSAWFKMLGVSIFYMIVVISIGQLSNAGLLLGYVPQMIYIVAFTAVVGWLWWLSARVKSSSAGAIAE